MADQSSGIDSTTLHSLREQVRGEVVSPDDTGYDKARRLWNGRFDRRPGAIAFCRDADDVAAAVRLAREQHLLLAVRSGGHDYAGNSMCEGGLVIDLSGINAVTVDAASRTARVGAGARWGEVDREVQAHGLACTGGTVSRVGVAGYTLGGGTGWLVRKHGLALDNVTALDVVLANGEIVRASGDENADLFWALRGGSGNVGIVTSFEYRLHELDPLVLAGQILYPLADAAGVLRACRAFLVDAPDEVQIYPFFLRVPPLDVFPEDYHGQVVLNLVVGYLGDPDRGKEVLAPVLQLGKPFLHRVEPTKYLDLQQTFDAAMPPGGRWYSRAHFLRGLPDDAIDTILRHTADMPGTFTVAYLETMGGAIARVDPAATAFPHREADFELHIFPGWTDPADDEAIMEWARTFHKDMAPWSTGGVYVNLLGGDEPDGPRSAYGTNYQRLADIKRRYDPDNLFRMNHNITP